MTGSRNRFIPVASSIVAAAKGNVMTTGHFGLALGVKAGTPRIPLWALFVAAYLLDIVFIVLVAAGVESFAPLNPGHFGYGQVLIHAYYSHSLVGALAISGVATLITLPIWGKRNAIVIGAVVLSHWILDLIVHRADLPILPGNGGHLPLLGFGLWNYPAVSAALEITIVAAGVYLYFRSSHSVAGPKTQDDRRRRKHAVVSTIVTGLLLALLAASDFLAVSTSAGILIMLLLIVLSGWLDSRIGWNLDHKTSRAEMAAS